MMVERKVYLNLLPRWLKFFAGLASGFISSDRVGDAVRREEGVSATVIACDHMATIL
jgi:hypothetical protein